MSARISRRPLHYPLVVVGGGEGADRAPLPPPPYCGAAELRALTSYSPASREDSSQQPRRPLLLSEEKAQQLLRQRFVQLFLRSKRTCRS